MPLSAPFSSSMPAEWNAALDEGQLSVDVFRHGNDLVIRSTVAGASPEDLDISFHGDLITIRGKREMAHDITEEDWVYRECYWGAFSRSIVLPYDVSPDKAEASLTNGVLEIRIPISTGGKKSIKVKVKE
jgi:HSP20 family protein